MTLTTVWTNAEVSSRRYLYTGKERDTESGNDYFGARYYSSAMGRFMSPDRPVDQHTEDPQSLTSITLTSLHCKKYLAFSEIMGTTMG